MSVFDSPHLRVEIPLTKDGVNLAYDSNGQVYKKIVYLPLSAEKHLKRRAARLPEHLRPVIKRSIGDIMANDVPTNGAANLNVPEAVKTSVSKRKVKNEKA